MKVLIPQDISEVGKNYLLDKGYEIKVLNQSDQKTLLQEIPDCDALLIRTAKVSKQVLEAGKKLKVVARHGVGLDNIDLETAWRLGIKVTNAPESNANCVAEHTIALMMGISHHLLKYHNSVIKGDWEIRNRLKLVDLDQKIVGIVGFGRIGRLVAKKLHYGLGMKVIAYNRSQPKNLPPYVEMKNKLEDLYAEADFVSIHLPATAQTKNSINLQTFKKMKKTAFLINTGRGEVIDEKDLCQALKNGLIAGAALDVLADEPPDKHNCLLTCPNIIFSPHCAALSQAGLDKMALHAAMGVDEVLTGKEVSWPVLKKR